MMTPGGGLDLLIDLADVLVVHRHRRLEAMRSREKAQDEPIIRQVVHIWDVG